MANSKRQDFFPNYMSWRVTESGADTFTTDKIFTPIPRSQVLIGNKATVMELLWWEVSVPNIQLDAAGEFIICNISTGGVPTDVLGINEGNTVTYKYVELALLTSGAALIEQPFRYDMQSKDGYGMLLATDAFHSSVTSTNTGIALIFDFRLYYRFVQIPVTEYIGIVQSQQTS